METSSSRETYEDHVRRYFGVRKGEAETRIRQAWRGQGGVGGGGY